MTPKLTVSPLRTRVFDFGERLEDFLREQIPSGFLRENSILAITSKIVSLDEGRRIEKDSINKTELVQRESDLYLGEIGHGCHLTIKAGLLIPSAGIDESNSDGDFYILFPTDPFGSAQRICEFLKQEFKLKNLGVILTDSHTTPLRRGVTGIALAYWGFRGVESFVGRNDLFGRALKMTCVNYVDALAASAVLLMGESNESCPLALVECTSVKFMDGCDRSEIEISIADDLYGPLIKKF